MGCIVPMTDHYLSIIVPCFNCADTLGEAIESVYALNLTIPLEVIIVNDASTDDTVSVIDVLHTRHEDIRVIAHTENRGGGAARNTGIGAARGDLIYCLDGDNLLDKTSLAKMIAFLDEKKCDGVVFHERKFFLGGNKRLGTSYFNRVTDRPLELADLFNNTGTMLDNFLLTKESYSRAGGYPEHHGFDTQSFEIRYLASGNVPWVCERTTFYHRQFEKEKKSYFERVYEKGEYSRNIYLSIEDILYLFSPKVRKQILEYQIFNNASLFNKNLMSDLKLWYAEDKENFFAKDYSKLLVEDGVDRVSRKIGVSKKIEDVFVLAVYLYRQGKYSDAIRKCEQLVQNGAGTTVVYYILLRAFLGLSGQVRQADIESHIPALISNLTMNHQVNDLRKSLPELVIGKIRRTLKRKTPGI